MCDLAQRGLVSGGPNNQRQGLRDFLTLNCLVGGEQFPRFRSDFKQPFIKPVGKFRFALQSHGEAGSDETDFN